MKRCAGTVMLAIVPMVFMLVAALPAMAEPIPAPGIQETPLDLVMLVDESGSLSNADVAREIQAAGTIAQTLLNPRSRVTIVGFGGVNGVAPRQDATTVVCQPTITHGAVNLEYLARCVRGLHRRTEAEGDDTDYAAALAQAMSYLGPTTAFGRQSPAGATKAIFLMTDGGLDVHRDLKYTKTGNWLAAAHHAVDLQLVGARAAGVEVWTLGFGTISPTNAMYLSQLAASGAKKACDTRAASQPRSIVVTNSADALDALYSLYAAAGCLGETPSVSTFVAGGQSRVLTVNIPAIASAGAISVNKSNPAIRVDFVMPNGITVTGGALDGSTFQSSGQDTAVEVLHVTNPVPGAWQIRLTAPAGMHSELVTATAFWQGAVRVSIFPAPPTARVGQPIQVTVSVLGINGPITNPATLSKIHVQVSVAGDGLSGPVNVPVSNSGEGPGTPTGVGDYRGTFVAPGTAGTLVFTGTAVGYGLHATQVAAPVLVSTVAALLQSTVTFPAAPNSLPAGQTVRGQIVFNNQTGQSQRVRLTLNASHVFATITTPQGIVQVPSGRSETGFTIAVGRGSPRGTALLEVKVVDAANPRIAYGDAPLVIVVISPPGVLIKYRWGILAALLLLALIAFASYARRAAHRAAVDVRGLYVTLRRDEGPVGPELKAPSKWADVFRFVIRDDANAGPRLDNPKHGDHPFLARRKIARGRRTDLVSVVTDEGEKYDVSIGGPSLSLDNGLHLAFRDKRRTRPGSEKPAGAGKPPPQAQTEGRTTSSFDDPWL